MCLSRRPVCGRLYVVLQERRIIVKPQRRYVVPHKRRSIVNPNEGKQIGIPKKESLGISNPKEYLSWHQKEVIPRCQRKNSNKDPSWRQKGLILRCQRENFVPTKFEIQIWVSNFGRGVKYSMISRDRFTFAQLTFLLSRKNE